MKVPFFLFLLKDLVRINNINFQKSETDSFIKSKI